MKLNSIGIYFQCIFLPFYVFIPYMIQIVWLTETVVGSKQRRSDRVDLCEINYLGSLLIDFE